MKPLATAVGLMTLATPVLAQSPSATWSGLPDRFQIDAGYFHLKTSTVLRFEGNDEVDFERDLAVPDGANTFWVDATWRLAPRHQVKLSFTRLRRERRDHTLTRDFVWGGDVYTAGLTARSETGSRILGGYYRYALVRKDRFEAGPTAGIGYLWLDAEIQASGTGGVTIDRSASIGNVTGALGGYATGWPARRLALHGDFLYIKVSPGDSQASVTDWRLGANYYVFHGAGLGVQYKYNRYRYDRDILSSSLGGHVTFQGFQAFLSYVF